MNIKTPETYEELILLLELYIKTVKEVDKALCSCRLPGTYLKEPEYKKLVDSFEGIDQIGHEEFFGHAMELINNILEHYEDLNEN